MLDPSMVEVEFAGVRLVGPEQFPCVVLLAPDHDRIVTIWISAVDTMALIDTALPEDQRQPRPSTHQLLADVFGMRDDAISQLAVTGYHNGVFVGEIVTESGLVFDARPSDVIIISRYLELPLWMDRDVLAQVAIHINEPDLQEYLDLSRADYVGMEEALEWDVDEFLDSIDFDQELKDLKRDRWDGDLGL